MKTFMLISYLTPSSTSLVLSRIWGRVSLVAPIHLTIVRRTIGLGSWARWNKYAWTNKTNWKMFKSLNLKGNPTRNPQTYYRALHRLGVQFGQKCKFITPMIKSLFMTVLGRGWGQPLSLVSQGGKCPPPPFWSLNKNKLNIQFFFRKKIPWLSDTRHFLGPGASAMQSRPTFNHFNWENKPEVRTLVLWILGPSIDLHLMQT